MNEKDEAAGALVRQKILDEKLERAAKTALTRKQQAWSLLKQTRNPLYVSLRYGFPVEDLERALEKIPNEEPLHKRLARRGAHSRGDESHETMRTGAELVDEMGGIGHTQPPESPPGREPGEDDERE
jgi:hypothetical protein